VNHGLSRAAAEGVGEFRHVAEHVVHAVASQRVSLRHDCGAGNFGTHFSAPYVGVGEEEILQFGGAVCSLVVEIFAF